MTRDEVKGVMERMFTMCMRTREDGQAEYAHDLDNAFANFERVGKYLREDRKKVLMTYLLKHIDGITAAVNGHMSQREPVQGRIMDAIVYLCLLEGMFEEESALIQQSSAKSAQAHGIAADLRNAALQGMNPR